MVILIDSGVNNPINSALQQKFNKPCKLERQLKNSLIQSILDSDIDFVLSKEQYSNSLQKLKSKYASLPNLKNSAICSTSQSCMNIQSSTSNGTISSTTNHPHFNNVAKSQNSHNSANANDGIPQPACIIFPSEQVEMSWSPGVFGGGNNFSAIGSGLANLGNTCYLNSTLQCLTYTPPLANYFVKQTTTSTSTAQNHGQKCHIQGFCAECEIGKHIKLVLSRAYQIYKPLNIVQNLKCIAKHFTPYRQEDAHEFFLHILEAMQKSGLNRFNNAKLDRFSKHTTLVHQIFGGYLRSRVICQVCKTPSDCYDPYLDISLDVKGTFNMNNALKKFTSPELIQNENAYKCESCKRMVSATKHVNLHRLARVNVFHLKRFTSSGMGKITQFFQYPETIDLAPYLSSSTAVLAGKPNKTSINANANTTYSLYAVLVHSGSSTKFGHYFCFCKAQNGSWYRLDDANVTPTSLQKVLSQEAYLLFYIQDTTKRTTNQNIFQTIPNGNLHSSPPSYNVKQQQNLPSKMSPGPNLKLGLVHKNSGNVNNGNSNIYVIKPSTALKQNGLNNPSSSVHRLQEKIILKRSTDTPNNIIHKSNIINNPPFVNTFKFLPATNDQQNQKAKQQNSTFENGDRKNSDKTAPIISGDKKILVPYEESGTSSSSHSSDSSPESNFLQSKNCSDIKNLNSTSNHSANSIKTNKIGENTFRDSIKNGGNIISEHDLNQIPLPCEKANDNSKNELKDTHQQFSPIKIVIKKVKDPSVSNSSNSNTLHKIVAITSNEKPSQKENVNKIPNSYGAEINDIENTSKQSSFKKKLVNLMKSKNHTIHKTKPNEFSFADKKLASHENIFTNFNDSKKENKIPPKNKIDSTDLKLNLCSSIAVNNTPMTNGSTNLFQAFNVVAPHKKRKNGQETEINTIEKLNNLSQNEFNSRKSLEKLKKKKHKKLKMVAENDASNLGNTPSPIVIANTASKSINMPENLGLNTENEQSTSNFADKTGKNTQQSNHLMPTSEFDNNHKEKRSFTQNLSKTTYMPNKTSAPTSFKEEMTKILQSQALSWESSTETSSATIKQDLVSNVITTTTPSSSNNFKQSSENPKNSLFNSKKGNNDLFIRDQNSFSGPFPLLTYQRNKDDKKRHKNSQQNYASNSTVVVNPFVKYVTK